MREKWLFIEPEQLKHFCNDVVTRTIVMGPLVVGPQSQDHFLIQPKSSRYNPAQYISTVDTSLLLINPYCWYIFAVATAPNRLASRSSPTKGPLFGFVLKGILGSAPVEVTVKACLGWEGVTSIRKVLAYSKLPWVEARCTACWTRQAWLSGGKR